jgi:hypothetical protein
MSSISIVSTRRFMLSDAKISQRELFEIAKQIDSGDNSTIERKVPFPQADDFERVIDITEFVSTEPRSKDDIYSNYEIHPRQADYYFSAARYLGVGELVRGSDGVNYRQITKLGESIINLPYAAKRKEFAKLVLEIPAVREIYLLKIEHGVVVDIAEAERIVSETSQEEGISGSTVYRRAQTVLAWVRWLMSLDAKG